MAKKQSFADKVTKHRAKGDSRLVVKLIESRKSEKGSWKFPERYVKVDSLDELDKALAQK